MARDDRDGDEVEEKPQEKRSERDDDEAANENAKEETDVRGTVEIGAVIGQLFSPCL